MSRGVRFARRWWPWLTLVLVAALARVAVHLELRDYVLYRHPLVDAEEYVAWARALAAGQPEPADVYYKAPMYPWVLAAAMRLFGPSVATALIVNACLGLVATVLLACWGRRVLGNRGGWLVAGVYALYGPLLYFEAQPLPVALAQVGLLASWVLLTPAGRAPPRPRALAAAGVTLGLLVLTRPSAMLGWAFVLGWLLWRAGPGAWRRTLFVGTTTLLVVAPVTLRNRVVGGAWVPVSANAGINFYLGNNPEARRTELMRPGLEWESLVTDLPAADRIGQARWDRAFLTRGLAWVRQHPLDFVAGGIRKAAQFLHAHEIDRNLDMRGFRDRSVVLRVMPRYAWFGVLLPLGVLALARYGRPGWLAIGWLFTVGLNATLFFVTERYRVDALPAILASAVAGGLHAWRTMRHGTLRRRVRAGAWLVLGAVVTFHGGYGIRDLHPAQASFLEGAAYYAEGRYTDAVERLRAAVRERPGNADAQYQLGTALQKQNRLAEALQAYEAAHRAAPRNPKPLVAAGWIHRRQGRPQEARAAYDEAAHLQPDNPYVLLERGALLEDLGDIAGARRTYARVRDLAIVPPDLRAEAIRRLRVLDERP